MPTSDTSGSSGSDNLQAVLAGLDLKPEQLDGQARQQAALLAFGRRTNAQPPVAVLMEDAAAMVAEIAGADRIGVGEVIRGGTALSLKVAGIDRHGALVDPVTNECAMEASLSMAGHALSLATPVICPDLASEKRFTDMFLRELGVTSALTIPLHSNGKPFGVLGTYAGRQRQFTLEDVQFSETIAHLLTSSLARIRAEEELHQQRSFASTVLDLVDTLVLTLDTEGRVVGMNRASQKATGFSVDEIRDRPFWNVLVAPEEAELVQGIFRSSRSERAPCEFEGYLLAKDGLRKRVSWSMKLMSDGKVQSIILSGVDQTDRIQTQAELQQARAMVEKAGKALKELCAMTEAKDRSAATPPMAAEALEAVSGPGARQHSALRPFQPIGARAALEQRVTLRRAYRYQQRIAPVIDGVMPKPDQFFEVQCNDISAGGISFFLDSAPDFDSLVVALGKAPAMSYFTARVARVAGVDHDGPKVYLVGCRFTGRTRL